MTDPDFILRPASPEDAEFLFELYAENRREEMAALGWTAQQQEAFLLMQHRARSAHYQATYPEASDQVIVRDGTPAGRMLVDRRPGGIVLVDLTLTSAHRSQGIGKKLLRRLADEAERERIPIRLQVLEGNPALRLYLRQGFEIEGKQSLYFMMTRRPTQV